jgi:hypothetical protein
LPPTNVPCNASTAVFLDIFAIMWINIGDD